MTPHWSQYQSPWTPVWEERILEIELGERAWSWAHDVNPYEHHSHDEIMTFIQWP